MLRRRMYGDVDVVEATTDEIVSLRRIKRRMVFALVHAARLGAGERTAIHPARGRQHSRSLTRLNDVIGGAWPGIAHVRPKGIQPFERGAETGAAAEVIGGVGKDLRLHGPRDRAWIEGGSAVLLQGNSRRPV